MEIEIRKIALGDAEQVRDLHRQHYWRKNCLLLDQSFYDWQFLEAPECNTVDHSVVAVDSKGIVLSYLGITPMTLHNHGVKINAAHLISWLSLPEVRGKGIGHSIMAHITARYEFLFGRSVTPAALAIYRKLGFRYFGSCLRWILILNAGKCLPIAIDPSEETERRLNAREVGAFACEFTVSSDVPPGTEQLCWRVLREAVTFARSHKYLDWRYARHPHLKYRFVSVGPAANPTGVAVVRIEDIRDKPGRVLRVVDFIAHPHAEILLAQAVCTLGTKEDCAYLDAFGMSEHFVRGIVSAGAFQWQEEDAIRLPYLLQPWDTTLAPPGLLFYSKKEPDGSCAADDVSALYFSKGDGNMDWPSWVPSDQSNTAPAHSPQTYAN